MSALSEWYFVKFDEKYVYRDLRPPGKDSWKDRCEWSAIIRICFQAGDLYTSDEMYIFVKNREESYLIPTEANGGGELWGEIIGRKLFDAKLAIEIASDVDGGFYCWPEFTPEEVKNFSKD